MTLTPATATASFTQMKTHLAKCRGTTGLPLEYVVRPQLKGPHDAPEDGPEDPPPCGDPESPYVTIDAELTAHAPILQHDLTNTQLARPLDHLEEHGPFNRIFIQDSAKVYDILHSIWGTSQPWTHARSVATKTKNGRKAFRVLHTHLLGSQQLVTYGITITTRLQLLQYDGDRRNFNFNKYVALQVAGHNDHDDLGAYGVEPLTKSLKILLWDYSKEEYACLTPTEKLKLWMIRNPGKTPGTGSTHQRRGGDHAGAASIASASLTRTKRTADASQEGDTANNDSGWGPDHSGNRDNSGIAGRQHSKSQKIDNDD